MGKNLFIIIIIGFLSLLFTGCELAPEGTVERISSLKDCGSYAIINLNGCQYIHYNNSLCHKGDCTNNIHVYRMEK